MLIAVLSSTVATTQTTLLPAARITLSMARDKVFPSVFASIQGKLKTPAVGTLILAFISLFGILLASQVASIDTLLNNLILSIGVLIAFYYGVDRGDVCLGVPQGGLPVDPVLLHRRAAATGGVYLLRSVSYCYFGHRPPFASGELMRQMPRAGAANRQLRLSHRGKSLIDAG